MSSAADGDLDLPEGVELSELMELTRRIATTAAVHIRTQRAELGAEGVRRSATTKSSEVDPVTAVDQSSEALIRSLISDKRPDDVIIGEEEGTGSTDSAEGSQDALTWIVDPIDGTVNFMYGIAAYGVSIAVAYRGDIVAGSVIDVAHGYLFSAYRGGGAFRSDVDYDAGAPSDENTNDLSTRATLGDLQPITVNHPETVAKSLIATGFAYDRDRRRRQGAFTAELLESVRDIRRIGSAALDLCFVACGLLDGHIEHGLNCWDYAAGALIASEAGAEVLVPPLEATTTDGLPVIAIARSVSGEMGELLHDLNALTSIDSWSVK